MGHSEPRRADRDGNETERRKTTLKRKWRDISGEESKNYNYSYVFTRVKQKKKDFPKLKKEKHKKPIRQKPKVDQHTLRPIACSFMQNSLQGRKSTQAFSDPAFSL